MYVLCVLGYTMYSVQKLYVINSVTGIMCSLMYCVSNGLTVLPCGISPILILGEFIIVSYPVHAFVNYSNVLYGDILFCVFRGVEILCTSGVFIIKCILKN